MYNERLYVDTYGIPALESFNDELTYIYARESAMILGFDGIAMEADVEAPEEGAGKVGAIAKLKELPGKFRETVDAIVKRIDEAITRFLADHKRMYAIAYVIDGAMAKVGGFLGELKKNISEAGTAAKEGAVERLKDVAVNIRHAHDELNSWKEAFQAAAVNKLAKSGMKAEPKYEAKVTARLRQLRKTGLGEGNKIVQVSESMYKLCMNVKNAGVTASVINVLGQVISLFVGAITAPISIAAYVIKGVATDAKIAKNTKKPETEEVSEA